MTDNIPRRPVATSFGDQVSGPPIGVLEPGPVWHVSVAPRVAYYGQSMCAKRAEQELAGLGDARLGEWREWSGTAFHLRRRLAAAEQVRVGPALDIRRTPEARRRAAAIGLRIDLIPSYILMEEIGG